MKILQNLKNLLHEKVTVGQDTKDFFSRPQEAPTEEKVKLKSKKAKAKKDEIKSKKVRSKK